MINLLLSWFRLGRLPSELRQELEEEGIQLFIESCHGRITYRKYRAPGKWYGWRRQWILGSFVVTKKSLSFYCYRRRVLKVALTDPRIKNLDDSQSTWNRLCVRYDPSLFDSQEHGNIEFVLKTEMAQKFQSILSTVIARQNRSRI